MIIVPRICRVRRKPFFCKPVPSFDILRLAKFCRVDGTTGCWRYGGRITENGYGQFRIGEKMYPAHRACYVWFNGQVPSNLVLDHLCKQRDCMNPDHLEVVTHRENTHRAWNYSETVCRHGHVGHFVMRKSGLRICLACKRELHA